MPQQNPVEQTPKQPSITEIIFQNLIYSLGLGYIIKFLFDNCVATPYNFMEVPFKLAFVIAVIFIIVTELINASIQRTNNHRILLIQELDESRQHLRTLAEIAYAKHTQEQAALYAKYVEKNSTATEGSSEPIEQ